MTDKPDTSARTRAYQPRPLQKRFLQQSGADTQRHKCIKLASASAATTTPPRLTPGSGPSPKELGGHNTPPYMYAQEAQQLEGTRMYTLQQPHFLLSRWELPTKVLTSAWVTQASPETAQALIKTLHSDLSTPGSGRAQRSLLPQSSAAPAARCVVISVRQSRSPSRPGLPVCRLLVPPLAHP